MKIYMIRHAKTAGNMEKRYIGRTDEPLCEEGIKELGSLCIPHCDMLISSPMRRCLQTARLLFDGKRIHIADELRECDFGDFEGKNYTELNGGPEYQRWIDSGGQMQFPNGEKPADFKERCCKEFIRLTMDAADCGTIAMVVHGGTIMSVLERFAVPRRDYYDWSVPCAHGYLCEYDGEIIKVMEKL